MARKGFQKLTVEQQQDLGLIATGLSPIFPAGIQCPIISSPFGSRTRYDGSNRTLYSNNGYHGGMDISLKIGTSLLAAANGKVIHVASGGRLVGNVIWMQHAPDDTGLKARIYTKYQHLDEEPRLNKGTKVKVGEVIGVSGDTGTKGGHFGNFGYPHLHMNVYASPNNKFEIRGHRVKIKNRTYIDPVAFFSETEISSQKLRLLPKQKKKIEVGTKLRSGEIIPAKANRIWPVFCQKKVD